MPGALTALALAFALWSPPAGDPPPAVRVTVVVVLATPDGAAVDPKLAELAREVRKREPALTGFRVHASEARSVPVGGAGAFALVEKQELRVTVERAPDDVGRVRLTIKPPGVGEVTYSCTCDKFFPVVTPYRTKAGETLIVAVMVKPCTMKK